MIRRYNKVALNTCIVCSIEFVIGYTIMCVRVPWPVCF